MQNPEEPLVNVELPFSAAAERNAKPIADKLAELSTGNSLTVLEIGSGTGQHVAFFAERFPGWRFQPSDRSDEYFDAIRQRSTHLANVEGPIRLDLLESRAWPEGASFDLVVAINVFQVAPVEVVDALYRLAAQALKPDGCIVTYSPLTHRGEFSSDGDAAFNQRLKERDPRLGIRALEDLRQGAEAYGFTALTEFPMPANNWLTWARFATSQ